MFGGGLVTGVSHLPLPETSLSAIKFGGQLRCTFVEQNQSSLYLQVVGFLPLRSTINTEVGGVRFGVTIPISNKDDFNFTFGLFVAYNSFDIRKPLLYDEKPDIVEHRGVGISLGIHF